MHPMSLPSLGVVVVVDVVVVVVVVVDSNFNFEEYLLPLWSTDAESLARCTANDLPGSTPPAKGTGVEKNSNL